MDTFVSHAKSQQKAQGFDEILIPGEPEERVATERIASGIPLTEEVINNLIKEGERFELDLTDYFRNPSEK